MHGFIGVALEILAWLPCSRASKTLEFEEFQECEHVSLFPCSPVRSSSTILEENFLCGNAIGFEEAVNLVAHPG